jgi:hypothetical protein
LKEEGFDPGDRGGFWTFGHLGFLCRASTIIPSIFGERFTCHSIYWSLERVGEKGATQPGGFIQPFRRAQLSQEGLDLNLGGKEINFVSCISLLSFLWRLISSVLSIL